MNILFISPYMPTQIRTRPYNLVRALARRGHSVTLATLWESEKERAALGALECQGIRVIAFPLTKHRIARNALAALRSGKPVQALYCWEPNLARRLESEVAHSAFDVIHVEHLRGAAYGDWLRARSRIPIVWDSVDCISFLFEHAIKTSRNLFGQVVTRAELPRTRRHEAWRLGRFDRVLVTSLKDKVAFADLAKQFGTDLACVDKIAVLPNGVDLDYFFSSDCPRDDRAIVFTGKMSYHANATSALYLVSEIMPRVWARVPDARVHIVGHKPGRKIKSLAGKYLGRVSVMGTVEDLRPYLGSAAVSVAPIVYGAGIQNKVLEAMAMATPVAATPLAVSALSVRNEEHVLLGNSPEELAQQIVRLLENAALRERVAQNARRYVEENYHWERRVEELEKIYASVMPIPYRKAPFTGGQHVHYNLAKPADVQTAG